MCSQFSIKDSVLLLLKKKQRKKNRFSAKSLVENFYKNIHNFKIKMFYQNRGQIFVLCYLIFAWVKTYEIKDFRLTILWDLHDLELAKVKNVSPKTVELIF